MKYKGVVKQHRVHLDGVVHTRIYIYICIYIYVYIYVLVHGYVCMLHNFLCTYSVYMNISKLHVHVAFYMSSAGLGWEGRLMHWCTTIYPALSTAYPPSFGG